MSTKMSTDALLEEISNLTLLEASELVKKMEEKFGISAAPTVIAGVSTGTEQQNSNAKAEEVSSFDVVLKSFGDKKINVIKAVREITSLPLKEAKEIVEAGNKSIKNNIDKTQAEEMKKKLEESGATVELKPSS